MTNPRILVVDDDPVFRAVLESLLLDNSFSVICAENGKQALEQFESYDIDLVMSDIQMPQMDGYDLCKCIRRCRRGVHTPIIVMTVSEDVASIEKAYMAGATDFVTKPLNSIVLPHRINYILRSGKATAERDKNEKLISKLGRVLDNSSNEIYIIDLQTFKFTLVNSIALANLGYTHDEALQLGPADVLANVSWREVMKKFRQLKRSTQGELRVQAVNRRKDGSMYDVEGHSYLSNEEDEACVVWIANDITERIYTEKRIQKLVFYDALTGLPNRELFGEEFGVLLKLAKRRENRLAILLIDLDNFRDVNDSLGHHVGDELLQEVSRIIKISLRESDILSVDEEKGVLARFGGDEFVILLNDIRNVHDPEYVAQRIVDNLSKSISIRGRDIIATPSIGIALFPEHGDTTEGLLRRADIAMYEAKKQGRSRHLVYEETIATKGVEQLEMERDLRNALDNGEFELHYQPQVDTRSGKILGVEALLRWNRNNTTPVSPVEFIPLAESTNIIVPIGEWVIRESCQQVAIWQRMFECDICMSVNLSGRQFDSPGLVSHIKSCIGEAGIEGKHLHLEITETLLMNNMARTLEILHQLKDMGCKISLDDFGTGYSSLRYLHKFPVDILKIDKSFISEIDTDSGDLRITLTIIAMAKSLNLDLVAEGVETESQFEYLKTKCVEVVQGYFFSKPLSSSQMEVKLHAAFDNECCLPKQQMKRL